MSRVLLLLPGATYKAPDFVAAARSLDAEVVIGCDQPQALAGSMGKRALEVRLGRPEEAAEAIVAHARETPLDAVVAVDDQGVQAAALAALRLGLPHNPPEGVARTRDKLAMRVAFATAGLRQPAFRAAGRGDDVAGLAAEVGFPCVVKPVSLSASRGVIRADDRAGAADAAERIRAILAQAEEDPDGTLLVEEFVPGPEVAVEGLLRGGELEVLAIFDKPDPLEGPFFEETLYVTPSRTGSSTQEAIERVVGGAVWALGLTEGPVHAELRIRSGEEDEAWMLELGARTIGGLCARALRFGAGISLEEVVLRHALGMPSSGLGREAAASGVMMLPIPRAGVLREVRGQEEARAAPGITGLELSIARGRPVVPLPEGDRYLGFLFARDETPEQVERELRAAHRLLEVVIEDPE